MDDAGGVVDEVDIGDGAGADDGVVDIFQFVAGARRRAGNGAGGERHLAAAVERERSGVDQQLGGGVDDDAERRAGIVDLAVLDVERATNVASSRPALSIVVPVLKISVPPVTWMIGGGVEVN